MDDLKYWVWLNSLENTGPGILNRLIDYFGSPENVWYSKERELKELLPNAPKTIERILDKNHRLAANGLLKKVKAGGCRIITKRDADYPERLKYIYDPPILLYTRGKLVGNEYAVAVVGARKATMYGMRIAEEISFELSARGIAIVSGMARGIDTCAHLGALKAEGRTIAVLGCGLDTAYPPENKGLMERITKNGAVVSEYPPGTPPHPYNFPARNRIISGMSVCVTVVEAGKKSGSLITADFALEQGREVFAVPGNILSTGSEGTNALIRDGARIVTGIEDIIQELKSSFVGKNIVCPNKSCTDDFQIQLSEEERKVFECISGEGLHIDDISGKTGFDIQKVNFLLVNMEIRGVLEQLRGKVFRAKK